MKINALILISILSTFSMYSFAQQTNDIEKITSVVNHYFEGVRDGDMAKLKEAFINTNMSMKAFINIDGKKQILSLADDEAFEDLAKRPSPDYTGHILSINVYNPDAAFVTFDFNGMFIDGFQMLKIDNRWWIVNKTFVERGNS